MKTFCGLFALAAIITISCLLLKKSPVKNASIFDFEAHRGGYGLMPENTIAAMKNAILGVTALETARCGLILILRCWNVLNCMSKTLFFFFVCRQRSL